jgi:enoyl-CoA hydratase
MAETPAHQVTTTLRRYEMGIVATITVDRPKKLNILGSDLMARLLAAVTSLGQEEGLRAVVLRGAGERAFIGGADIGEMATLTPATAEAFITLLHRCCAALRALPVPVIARIDGYALGAGLEIAAACDLRLASERAVFGMPEVRVGIPSVIEAALLPGLIGWGRTRWLLLTGETIDAMTAQQWGLVEKVVPPAKLDDAVEDTLASILACGARALSLQKSLMQEWEDLRVGEAIAAGIGAFVESWRGDEPRRMMQAFLERRRK